MSVFPYWLELVRACAALLIWVLTPLMVWFTVWSVKQHQKWEAGKLERFERWKAGMDEVSRTREEAHRNREEAIRLRGQAETMLAHAEVALAQARRHHLQSAPVQDDEEPRRSGFDGTQLRTNGLGSPATTAQESPYRQSANNI